MEFYAILCLFCAVIAGVNGLQERDDEKYVEKELTDALDKLKLVEKLEKDNSTRDARGLLKKLSFLAGMQVGGLLHSSGTLAASNSVRIFGKVVNSALSVSYGSLNNEFGELPGVGFAPGVEHDSHGVKDDGPLPQPPPPSTTTSIAQRQANSVKELLSNHNKFVSRVNNKYLRADGLFQKSNNR